MTEPIQSEEPRVKKALKYIKSMLTPGAAHHYATIINRKGVHAVVGCAGYHSG